MTHLLRSAKISDFYIMNEDSFITKEPPRMSRKKTIRTVIKKQ
jgi:hypothetical protein